MAERDKLEELGRAWTNLAELGGLVHEEHLLGLEPGPAVVVLGHGDHLLALELGRVPGALRTCRSWRYHRMWPPPGP